MLDSPFGIQRLELENLVHLIYVPKVPHILQFFYLRIEKSEKISEYVQK